jgi:hypothetical protein
VASGQRKSKAKLDFNWTDTPAQVLAITGPGAKAPSPARASEESTSPASAQMGRLEQFITSEAVHLREKGATSVGVALKVDAQTQLFLQLTNKDGQLQASLRCERGDFYALDSQWAQLQQALARQNVQLLPQANGAGASANFHQPAEHRPRQLPQTPQEGLVPNSVVEKTQTRNPKPQSRARPRWESWA